MTARTEAIRRMGNPWAKLSLMDEDELAHEYVRRSENPYAALEIFGEAKLEQVTLPLGPKTEESDSGSTQVLHEAAPKPGTVSKADFDTRCRSIFLQYEPIRGTSRQLRPEFRQFISENRDKAPEPRALILRELERYDLSKMGNLKPYLNREHESSLLKKLADISAIAG